MKILFLFIFIFLTACSSNTELKNYDYTLKSEDVVCKEIKKEQTQRCVRFCTQYMTVTSKCSFVIVNDIYLEDYVKKEELKKTIEEE